LPITNLSPMLGSHNGNREPTANAYIFAYSVSCCKYTTFIFYLAIPGAFHWNGDFFPSIYAVKYILCVSVMFSYHSSKYL